MSKILALFILITVAGCAKVVTSGSLTGNWKLIATLADPGDGSGRWTPAAGSEMSLKSDGTVTGTADVNYIAYKIGSDNKIEFTLKDRRKQVTTYSISGDTLIIRPQCIEACGFKYLRK